MTAHVHILNLWAQPTVELAGSACSLRWSRFCRENGIFDAVFSHIRIWPTANASVTNDVETSTSSRLIMCKSPPDTEEGIFKMSVGINGQQYTVVQDPDQQVIFNDPPANLSSSITALLFLLRSGVRGGEAMSVQEDNFERTAAAVRFRNDFGDHEPVFTDSTTKSVRIKTTPNYLFNEKCQYTIHRLL